MNLDNVEKIYQVVMKFRKLKLGSTNQRSMPSAELMMMWRIAYGGNEKGVTISRLGELLEISTPAVSQKVNALEKRNLVHRYTSEEDRRCVLVKLTPDGEQMLEKESKRMMAKLVLLFEDVDEADAECFFRVLSKMYDSVSRKMSESKIVDTTDERGKQ